MRDFDRLLIEITEFAQMNSFNVEETQLKCLRDGFNLMKYGIPKFKAKKEAEQPIANKEEIKENKTNLYGE